MKIGNLEVYGIIYKITNKINNKVYIGQTTDGFKIRYNGGKWWVQTHNHHLKSSVEKYGINNFSISEVFDVAFSKDELNIKEILYIKKYKSNNRKYGYNKKDGGSNGKHSEESIKKMSIVHSGVKLSQETKNKMSIVRKGKNKGENNPMYGKNPFANMPKDEYDKLIETRRKNMTGENNPMYASYGELNPFYGREHSEETKKVLSEKAKERLKNNNPLKGRKNTKITGGNNPKSKNNIEVYNEEMELIYVFDSVKSCAEWLVKEKLIGTFNSAKDAINTFSKKNKFYKGYLFKKQEKKIA